MDGGSAEAKVPHAWAKEKKKKKRKKRAKKKDRSVRQWRGGAYSSSAFAALASFSSSVAAPALRLLGVFFAEVGLASALASAFCLDFSSAASALVASKTSTRL